MGQHRGGRPELVVCVQLKSKAIDESERVAVLDNLALPRQRDRTPADPAKCLKEHEKLEREGKIPITV